MVLRPNAEAHGAEAADPKGTQKGKGSRSKGKGKDGRQNRRGGGGRRARRRAQLELEGEATALRDPPEPRGAGAVRNESAARRARLRRGGATESDGARAGEARARSPPPRLQSPAVVRPRLRPLANPLLVGPPSPGGTRRVRFGPCAASPSPEGRARPPLRPGSPHPEAQPRGAALRPRAAEAPASPRRGGGARQSAPPSERRPPAQNCQGLQRRGLQLR